tara:strand:- start:1200 stop:1862 length:663 start_codon:yes stop_codon:yes gene_type:complete
MKDKVIIFGTGDISQIAAFYLSEEKEYEVIAFTMDSNFIKDDEFQNKPLVAFETLEEEYPPDEYKLFIPLSYTDINKLREKKYLEAKNRGYKFISYISKKASIANNSTIGENCFIFEDNTIQPFVKIEDNCILWSGNHIGHHSTIKKNVFISSHVVVAGGCTIGENSFLGVNATLRDHISIGKYNIIGMGALILRSTEADSVFVEKATEISSKSSHELKL